MIQFSACPVGLFAAPLVESDKEAVERRYQLWRIENGVAEGSTKIPKGKICFCNIFCQDNAIL
jgi:hypothetical protein